MVKIEEQTESQVANIRNRQKTQEIEESIISIAEPIQEMHEIIVTGNSNTDTEVLQKEQQVLKKGSYSRLNIIIKKLDKIEKDIKDIKEKIK